MRVPLPISWHVQDWADNRVGRYVQRVLPFFLSTGTPFWIKGIDPPEEKPDWVVDGVNVLGRMFEADDKTWADMSKGKDGAKPFFDRYIGKWMARSWVDVWTMGNEPHPPSDPVFLAQLREFLMELADLMHNAGLKCGGPNISVGCPDIGLMPILGPAIEKLDLLIMHEYSAPAMWTTYPWHVGRIFMAIQELVNAGFTNLPPAHMGEWGIDGGVAPVYQGGTSWRTWAANEDEYVQQMVWAAKMYMEHPGRVEAAYIFTVAPPGWGWDDFTPTDALFDKVADAVLAGVEVDEEPIPVPPPEFKIIDVVDDLPVHPDEDNVYDDRLLGSINGVVIHHSGYAYPADATYDQVRAHLDVIANYHIREKDWPGIAYHFVVDGAGRVWQTQDIWTVSYHCGARNADTIGICMLGAFHLDTDPTDAQLRAVNCLIQRLNIYTVLEADLEILAHKQIVATACPGKISRWWDKIIEERDGCFEEEPEKPENGGDMDIQIVDQLGNELDLTWEDVQTKYGLVLVRAEPPAGEKVWRVRRLIWDKSPDTNYRTYCRDESGMPKSGITTFLGLTPGDYALNLPPDAAPLLAGTVPGQPINSDDGQPYPNVALKHESYQTNGDGYMQHSLGAGSNTVIPRPVHQWAWVMPGDYKWFSDWIYGVGGMFVDEESGVEHQMWWVEFWLQDANGGTEPVDPEDGDLVAHVPDIEIEIKLTIPGFTVPVTRVVE